MRFLHVEVVALAALSMAGCHHKGASPACPDGNCDTGLDYLCGNGEYDGKEQCDSGQEDGWGNCQADCTLVDDMYWTLGETILTLPLVDATGLAVDGAPLGDGAWSTSANDKNLDGTVKFELNIATELWDLYPLDALEDQLPPDFPAPGALPVYTLADIESISFQTYKTQPTSHNYYLVLYTAPDGEDDLGTFFGHALYAHPPYARNNTETTETWVTWNTEDGDNQLVFADKPLLGTSGGSGLPSLSELVAEPSFNWSAVNAAYPDAEYDYQDETLLYLSLQTSSGDSSTGFDGLVDALVVRFRDGISLTIDLEPDLES